MTSSAVVILLFSVAAIYITGSATANGNGQQNIRGVVSMLKTSAKLGYYDGENTTITKHPSDVYYYYNDENRLLLCYGSIISKHYILTTGDCGNFFKTVIDSVTVIAGSDGESIGDTYYIKDIKIHPNYTHTVLSYDIALIKTSKKIKFGPKVKSIRISKHEPRVESELSLSGWSDPIYKTGMREAVVYACDIEKCQKAFPDSELTDTNSCSFSKRETFPCFGHTSMPLVQKNELKGLIIEMDDSDDCSARTLPSIEVDVTKLKGWIHTTIHS